MNNKNLNSLEDTVNRDNSKSGHISGCLIFGGLTAMSILGAYIAGCEVARGHNIGIGAASLGMIIPVGWAFMGYKFPHLSAKGNPYSNNYKIPSPLESSTKRLLKGLAFQTIFFAAGYLTENLLIR